MINLIPWDLTPNMFFSFSEHYLWYKGPVLTVAVFANQASGQIGTQYKFKILVSYGSQWPQRKTQTGSTETKRAPRTKQPEPQRGLTLTAKLQPQKQRV